MVFDYIAGRDEMIDGVLKRISYFNIVDIPRLKDGLFDIVSSASAYDKMDHKKDFSVDEDVLNFFLQRKQFKKAVQTY